jgi:transposase-like protein
MARDRGAAERWRERVAQWRASGLSVAEFCRREGLSSPSFYIWRKRLQAGSVPHGLGFGSRTARARRTEQAPRMLPVQVVDSPNALAVGAARLIGGSGALQIEIALPRGVTVRTGIDVDESLLRGVLRAVVAETGGC